MKKLRYNWIFIITSVIGVAISWYGEVSSVFERTLGESVFRYSLVLYCLSTILLHLFPINEFKVFYIWRIIAETFIGLVFSILIFMVVTFIVFFNM